SAPFGTMPSMARLHSRTIRGIPGLRQSRLNANFGQFHSTNPGTALPENLSVGRADGSRRLTLPLLLQAGADLLPGLGRGPDGARDITGTLGVGRRIDRRAGPGVATRGHQRGHEEEFPHAQPHQIVLSPRKTRRRWPGTVGDRMFRSCRVWWPVAH